MCKKIMEKLETPVADEYDIIVCGGGPSGIGAAVTAARQGKRTMLIEQNGCLGGMWTSGFVNPLFDHQNKGGLVREIVEKLTEQHAFGAFWDMCFDYETMKLLLDDLCETAGVTVLFHTTISTPIVENNQVKGVIVENKSGRQAYLAQTVIDCTGDGDVAARAGAEVLVGRDSDHATQPMTLMFLLGNVDYWQNDATELYALMKKAVETHETDYRITYTAPFIIRLPKGRYAVVQLTHLHGYSGIDASSLSAAEQEGRKMVRDAVNLFKTYIPELKDVDLVATASQIGVRESRRIVGDYLLTKEDVLAGRHFPDGIANVSFNMDVHEPGRIDQTCQTVKPYQIPYRCLIPKNLNGLLVAGRCISGDHQAHASYRVTGNCVATGEAAGLAAAIACDRKCSLREVKGEELKKQLGILD